MRAGIPVARTVASGGVVLLTVGVLVSLVARPALPGAAVEALRIRAAIAAAMDVGFRSKVAPPAYRGEAMDDATASTMAATGRAMISGVYAGNQRTCEFRLLDQLNGRWLIDRKVLKPIGPG